MTPAVEQCGQVVKQVGGLFVNALIALLEDRAADLFRLLAYFRGAELWVA